MEVVIAVVVGLCVLAIGAYLIECLFEGADFILKCASELGFIGVIAYWLAWIFFFPIMLAVSVICGLLL